MQSKTLVRITFQLYRREKLYMDETKGFSSSCDGSENCELHPTEKNGNS